MKKPPHVIEIFLQPGELYFGDCDTRIRTVLGSCVSLTVWHPELCVGGMCHYMLPSRAMERRSGASPGLDGRYAEEAIQLLMREIDATGRPHHEYQVKIFGGGNMFPGRSVPQNHVGSKNVDIARRLVAQHGLNCVAQHLGGMGHRNLIFDVWNGNVWMKQVRIARNETQSPHSGERRMQCAEFA